MDKDRPRAQFRSFLVVICMVAVTVMVYATTINAPFEKLRSTWRNVFNNTRAAHANLTIIDQQTCSDPPYVGDDLNATLQRFSDEMTIDPTLHYDIILLIMSAPCNSDIRRKIREGYLTWTRSDYKNMLRGHKVAAIFVIGRTNNCECQVFHTIIK